MTECEMCHEEIPEGEPIYELDDLYVCLNCYERALDMGERWVETSRDIEAIEEFERRLNDKET